MTTTEVISQAGAFGVDDAHVDLLRREFAAGHEPVHVQTGPGAGLVSGRQYRRCFDVLVTDPSSGGHRWIVWQS